MAEVLQHELLKARASEILKATRRVVTLERRQAKLNRQLEETAGELRQAKRTMRDLIGEVSPVPIDSVLYRGELS